MTASAIILRAYKQAVLGSQSVWGEIERPFIEVQTLKHNSTSLVRLLRLYKRVRQGSSQRAGEINRLVIEVANCGQ